MLNKIDVNKVKIVCTDGNYAYSESLPESVIHKITKAETCLVESYNSVLRYYLARLHRKTKCYSKSKEMLRLSVLLLLNSWKSTYLL